MTRAWCLPTRQLVNAQLVQHAPALQPHNTDNTHNTHNTHNHTTGQLASAAEMTGGLQFVASAAVAVDEACFDERDEYAHMVSVKLEQVAGS